MLPYPLTRIKSYHDRLAFDSDSPLDSELGNWRPGPLNERLWVLTPVPGSPQILAYYSVGPDPYDLLSAPGFVPDHPVDVVYLTRLAVRRDLQGQGIGTAILRDLVGQIVQAARHHPIEWLVLEAFDDRSFEFYLSRDLGFETLDEYELKLGLPIETMRELVRG